MDPVTLLSAATTLGTAFIGIVPELIKFISERKNKPLQTTDPKLQGEGIRIQQDIEQIKQMRLPQQLGEQNQQTLSTSSNLQQEHLGQEFYREQFRQQKQLEQQLASYNRQAQLEIANEQRKTALQLPEVNKIFDNWPLTLTPSQILDKSSGNKRSVLRIFLNSQVDQSLTKIERAGQSYTKNEIERKLEQGLSEFLDQHYSLQDEIRPTEFLGGMWDRKRARREASIKALFSMLKSEPTLVLESEIIDNRHLELRIGYWGLGQETYCYQSITKLPYQDIMNESARTRALKWKTNKDKLTDITSEELSNIGGQNEYNLRILQQEIKLQQKGIDPRGLDLHYSYKNNEDDVKVLCQVLIACHCLTAGWISDAYHYLHYDVSPLLPKLILDITNELQAPEAIQPVIQGIVTGYRMLYASLIPERPSWMSELSLQLAQSLSYLPDKSWALEQAYHSVKLWLRERQVPPVEGIQAVEKMQSVVTLADRGYIEDLKRCFKMQGDQEVISKLLNLDWTLALKQREWETLYKKAQAQISSQHYREALDNSNQAIAINPENAEVYLMRGYIYAQLQNYPQAIKDYTYGFYLISERPPGTTNLGNAYYNRGNAYYRIHNYEAAIKDYDQAVELNPKLAEMTKIDQYRDDAYRLRQNSQ